MTTENVVSWTVDGETTSIDLHGITGLEWRLVRLATGMRHAEAIHAALVLKDFEAIAGLLWVALLRTKPTLTYEDVLGSLSIASLTAEEAEPETAP